MDSAASLKAPAGSPHPVTFRVRPHLPRLAAALAALAACLPGCLAWHLAAPQIHSPIPGNLLRNRISEAASSPAAGTQQACRPTCCQPICEELRRLDGRPPVRPTNQSISPKEIVRHSLSPGVLLLSSCMLDMYES